MSQDETHSTWKLTGWTIGTWLLAHITLIAGHVALVFFYSIAVAPGLPAAEYTAFAQRSGPWFSIIAGGPVFYLLARFLYRKLTPHGRTVAFVVWALYSITDLTIVLLSLDTIPPLLKAQWIASQGIKLAAVWLATRPRPA